MIEGQEGVTWDDWVALAKTCERAGIEALFRSDHFLSPGAERDALDAWTTIAGLAARTSTLRLGTLVSPVTFRHPTILAKAAVTADHISGGRIEVGIGAGWMEEEHRAFGFRFPPLRERMEMLAEQLEIVHAQWTQERFSFAGKHYTLEDCPSLPKPIQQPHPPLIVGGKATPASVEPAVRFATEYNNITADVEELRRRRRVLDEACEHAGRDPSTLRMSYMTGFVLGSGRDELLEQARLSLERWGSPMQPEEALERYASRGVAGTPDEFVEGLRGLADAGVERVMLQHIRHDDLETVELLGREVVPKLT